MRFGLGGFAFLLTVGTGSAESTVAPCAGAENGLSTVRHDLREGRVEAGLDRLASLASSHPDCAPVLLMQAQVHARRGEDGQAEAIFVRACEAAPDHAEPHFQLGAFYDDRQQHGQAVEQFRHVLAITPADPQAYDYLGLSLEALGEFSRAESAYVMGLARNSGPRFDPMLHYNYGRFLVKHGRPEDARRHLDEAVRLAPRVRAVHYERARLAEQTGELVRARKHAETALKLADPGGVILDMQVHYLLSRIYRLTGEDALAAHFTALTQKAEIPLSARRRSAR